MNAALQLSLESSDEQFPHVGHLPPVCSNRLVGMRPDVLSETSHRTARHIVLLSKAGLERMTAERLAAYRRECFEHFLLAVTTDERDELVHAIAACLVLSGKSNLSLQQG